MAKPVRIQLRRTARWNLSEVSRAINGLPAVKVDRTTLYGNPYAAKDMTGRCDPALLVQLYRDWLNDPEHHKAAIIRASLPKLRGKNLACWCAPDAPCHADVLLEMANDLR